MNIERERAVQLLSAAYGNGQIGEHALESRLTAVYSAQTVDEIWHAVNDLVPAPVVAARVPPRPPQVHGSRIAPHRRRRAPFGLLPMLLIAAFIFSGGAFFWPLIFIVPFMIGGGRSCRPRQSYAHSQRRY